MRKIALRKPLGRRPAGPRVGALLAALATVLLIVPAASAQSLEGSLVPGVGFPNRTLVLSMPGSVSPTAQNLQVTENGTEVRNLSITSLRQAGPSDLGVVIVVDTDPSMIGAPLDRALAAARTLAAQRTGGEQIGVVFGDGVSLPLTSDASAIDQVLASAPKGHSYRNLSSMIQQAVTELSAAGIADRAIIYVTDDIDREQGSTPQSIGAYAQQARVRIFTVGVRDAIWAHPLPEDLPPSSMRTLAASAGGSFIEAVPSQLRAAFADIEAGLLSQYVVHYRSLQPYRHQVSVSARVDGVPGVFTTTYASPAPPVLPGRVVAVSGKRDFWASSLSLAVVVVGAAFLIALATAVITAHYTRSGELRDRVHAFLPAAQPLVKTPTTISVDFTGSVERLLSRRRWWPEFVSKVEVSGIKQSPTELVYFAIGGSLIAALLTQLIFGSILISILALVIGPLVMRALVNRGVRKQRILFQEQLPGQLHEIASAMRTGRSLVEAVAVTAPSAEEPIRRELESAVADERAGAHLDEALLPIAERMDSSEIEQVAVVAALHRRTGANITEVLDRVAETARQRVEIRRELRALTAQARLSRNILTALPPLVVIAIDLIGHEYEKPLFHTTPGLAVLVLGAVMVTTGHWVMKKIVDIEE